MSQAENIRIAATKTLSSGKQQIKFVVEDDQVNQYGYFLVNEPVPVGTILAEIKDRLEQRRAELENVNPFFPVLPMESDPNFLLFSA
jgi:hypothetical protein